jgi:protein-L-isoaspartate O-methyltransferase
MERPSVGLVLRDQGVELAELIERGNGRDRAYVDAIVRMEWARSQDPGQRTQLGELHAALQEAALRSHAALRQQIAQGRLRASTLRPLFEAVPLFERDHFVEEVLGIAYPPLEEPALLTSEHMTYAPSGYDEIVHAFDLTQLGPGDRFLDLGAGLGKVAILATLLTGAESSGVESDARLCDLGRAAAIQLGVPGVQLRRGDAREASSTDADVVFMYLPFAGEALTRVMDRLRADGGRPRTRTRPRFLCTGPLDPARYPELVPVGAAKSWLNVYAWR